MKISPKKYAQALADTLQGESDPKIVIQNFLLLLQKKKQLRLLAKILTAFEAEWRNRRGEVKISVTYPPKFQESVAQLAHNLTSALGKSLEVESRPTEGLLGGFRVRIEDTEIDASLSTRLKNLEHRFNS